MIACEVVIVAVPWAHVADKVIKPTLRREVLGVAVPNVPFAEHHLLNSYMQEESVINGGQTYTSIPRRILLSPFCSRFLEGNAEEAGWI